MYFWFVVGSQFLYGEETLKKVEQDCIEIVNGMKLPWHVEYKGIVKTSAEYGGRFSFG